MPIDYFEHHGDQAAAPARRAFHITPDDAAPLTIAPKALIAGTAGTIVLRAIDSSADVTIPVTAGQILPVRASHVRSTGTTVSQIVGLA